MNIGWTSLCAIALTFTQITSAAEYQEIPKAIPVDEVPQSQKFGDAFALFKNVCFKPLPDSESFFTAMDASGIKWIKDRKMRDSKLGRGDSWSALEGKISYQYLPATEFSVTDPACEYQFDVGDDFDHQLAIQEISTFLILKSKNTSNKDATETCWQGELDDGRHVRLKLASQFSNTPKARLSVGFIKKFPIDLEARLRRTGKLNCK